MLNITGGVIDRPQRVVLYGGEGIGKTTLASKFPEPLFIDTENGSSHIDVRRVNGVRNWNDLIAAVNEIARTPDVCRTLVIDTLDRAEMLATNDVLMRMNLKSIEAAGYGKGYVYLAETFADLLRACDNCIAHGKHVVLIAHAKMRKFEQPDELGAYDRWEMKLTRQVAPMVKEWCDMLLFLNYKTIVVTTDDKRHKAQGGRRTIYTTHRPTYDAKNRHGLADELPMEWASLAPVFDKPVAEAKETPKAAPVDDDKMAPAKPETLETLRKWMDEAAIKPEELQALVAKKGHFQPETGIEAYPERFIRNWVFRNWEKIVTTINNDPEHVPF